MRSYLTCYDNLSAIPYYDKDYELRSMVWQH
jgi:hypothetical protein